MPLFTNILMMSINADRNNWRFGSIGFVINWTFLASKFNASNSHTNSFRWNWLMQTSPNSFCGMNFVTRTSSVTHSDCSLCFLRHISRLNICQRQFSYFSRQQSASLSNPITLKLFCAFLRWHVERMQLKYHSVDKNRMYSTENWNRGHKVGEQQCIVTVFCAQGFKMKYHWYSQTKLLLLPLVTMSQHRSCSLARCHYF